MPEPSREPYTFEQLPIPFAPHPSHTPWQTGSIDNEFRVFPMEVLAGDTQIRAAAISHPPHTPRTRPGRPASHPHPSHTLPFAWGTPPGATLVSLSRVLLPSHTHARTPRQTGSIDNEFRVFPMEVLAGEATTVTEVVQHGALFRLDYAQVGAFNE